MRSISKRSNTELFRLYGKKVPRNWFVPIPGKSLCAVDLDCFVDKQCGAFAADTLDIFGHAVTGDIHLSQTSENLFGAGVVMLRDEILQLGDQCLRPPRTQGEGGELCPNSAKMSISASPVERSCSLVCPAVFLLKFLVRLCYTPHCLGFGSILVHFGGIKNGKIHVYLPFFLNFACKVRVN